MTNERTLLLVLGVTYVVFLAWYDGWWMSPLTDSEVDAYLANLHDDSDFGEVEAVSYTQLTLPTICSV